MDSCTRCIHPHIYYPRPYFLRCSCFFSLFTFLSISRVRMDLQPCNIIPGYEAHPLKFVPLFFFLAGGGFDFVLLPFARNGPGRNGLFRVYLYRYRALFLSFFVLYCTALTVLHVPCCVIIKVTAPHTSCIGTCIKVSERKLPG